MYHNYTTISIEIIYFFQSLLHQPKNNTFIEKKMKMYKNFDEMPVMLSVPQTAEVLGISRVSVYKPLKTDKSFPAVVMGSRISIPKEQLKEWIDMKAKR